MKINFLAGVIGAALTLSSPTFAQAQDNKHKISQPRGEDDGMQQAIAFQRAKDRADARQARLEERHPSVNYSNADRRVEESKDGHTVTDPGEAQVKKHKK